MVRDLLCAARRWELARAAVTDGERPASPRLVQHLERCEPCRRAWGELRGLASDLANALPAAAPSPGFLERVWRRIGVRAPRLSPGVATLCAAGVLLVAMFAGLFREPETTAPLEQPLSTVAAAPAAPGSRIVTSAPRAEHREAASVPTRAGGTSRRPFRSRQPISPSSAEPDPRWIAISPGAWTLCGAVSETGGDYELAAAAYGQAFEITGHPTLGIAAGRAAETAGNLSGAVDYYSALLEGEW